MQFIQRARRVILLSQPFQNMQMASSSSRSTSTFTPRARGVVLLSQPLQYMQMTSSSRRITSAFTPRASMIALLLQPLQHMQMACTSSNSTSIFIPRARRVIFISQPLQHMQMTSFSYRSTSLFTPGARRVILFSQPFQHIHAARKRCIHVKAFSSSPIAHCVSGTLLAKKLWSLVRERSGSSMRRTPSRSLEQDSSTGSSACRSMKPTITPVIRPGNPGPREQQDAYLDEYGEAEVLCVLFVIE
jgi:hypothetical protein